MPKGKFNGVFTEEEKMAIALKYKAEGHRFPSVRYFIQWQMDGGSRRRCNGLKADTVRYWLKKIEQGKAPGDDQRRYVHLLGI